MNAITFIAGNSNLQIVVKCVKYVGHIVKGKGFPITGHEGPEGE
jgi:hypothetical protein